LAKLRSDEPGRFDATDEGEPAFHQTYEKLEAPAMIDDEHAGILLRLKMNRIVEKVAVEDARVGGWLRSPLIHVGEKPCAVSVSR
jgi:hypothetical protein